MNQEELQQYFLNWRNKRLDKLAPAVIQEFKTHPEWHVSVHRMAISKASYPFQEYASWLSSHLIHEFYTSSNAEKINEIIDAYLQSENHTVKRNLLKIINCTSSDYRSGELLSKSIEVLSSPHEAIALRSYSFQYVLQWINHFPELVNEIDACIGYRTELFKTPAMQICLKRYLKLKAML
jgi:hypothetical protein